MSTDITYAEPASVNWEAPLAEIADGEIVPAGKYAITLSTGSGGVVIVGTPVEIEEFRRQVIVAAQQIANDASKPLSRGNFEYDSEDGGFPCPRCGELTEPGNYSDVAGLVLAIDVHIARHEEEAGRAG